MAMFFLRRSLRHPEITELIVWTPTDRKYCQLDRESYNDLCSYVNDMTAVNDGNKINLDINTVDGVKSVSLTIDELKDLNIELELFEQSNTNC